MVENEPDVEVIVRTLKQLALFLLVRLRDRASSSFAGLSLPVRYLTACPSTLLASSRVWHTGPARCQIRHPHLVQVLHEAILPLDLAC